MALNNGRATLLSICLEHVHLATIQPRSLNKPGSGWHYSSETNSRESIGPFEKESYSCTRIKFKAAINLKLNGMLFLVFGPKCEQTSIPTLRILDEVDLANSELYLLGDFNCPINSAKGKEFIKFMSHIGLNQLIRENTRVTATSSSLIDMIFINSHRVTESGLIKLSISDHYMISL